MATDANPDLVHQLVGFPGAVDQLSALVTGVNIVHVQVSASMRLQAAGILVNVAGSSARTRSSENQAELSRVVLPLLLEQMMYDPSALKSACAALAISSSNKVAGESEEMEVDGEGSVNITSGIDKDKLDSDRRIAANVAAESVVGAAAAVSAATPMHITTNVSADGDEAPGGGTGVVGAGEREGEDCKNRTEQEAAADQPDKDAEVRWGWKLNVAEPLKLTAEVMTNLCALAAEEDGQGDTEDEEEEWGSDDEDAMERAARGGAQQDANGKMARTKEQTVLLDALADGGALQRTVMTLRALLAPTPRDRPPADATGAGADEDVANRLPLPAGTAADLADLRATVALCSANLVQNLPPRALGTDPHLLWSDLYCMCEGAVERAPSCVETLTGVLWGLVRRAGPAVAAGIRAKAATETAAATAGGAISAGPPLLLLRLCDPEATRSFEARVNAVGMLGALGATWDTSSAKRGKGKSPDDELGFGRALVQAMEDPHVLVQAEALNAVMDVYGEDGRYAAFQASGAPAALAAGVPAFRRKVKEEGKALGRDAMCHLKETALNANRFVKYKQAAATGVGGKDSGGGIGR